MVSASFRRSFADRGPAGGVALGDDVDEGLGDAAEPGDTDGLGLEEGAAAVVGVCVSSPPRARAIAAPPIAVRATTAASAAKRS